MKDTIFQQILKPLSKKLFEEGTKRFQSDYCYKTFKTREHLLTMIIVHIYGIKSLRTLEVALEGHSKLGISSVRRSTLSDANNNRSAQPFYWFLSQLLTQLPRKMRQDVKKVVRLLDSSPIQLKGPGYDHWAKPQATRRCQGLKLHVEYDLELKSPMKVAISHPNYNDSTMGKNWPIAKETIYVFDKGYCDYNWWWSIHQQEAYFVTRLKKNTALIMETQHKVFHENILEDGTFTFKNKSPRGGKKNSYGESLRRISVAREGKTPLILVTNIQDLPAETISELYKARWEIELFFKWIKQHLKIKKFLGKSSNAVKIQLATALITYLLVHIFKQASGDKRSLHLLLVWIAHNLKMKKQCIPRKQSPPIYRFNYPYCL